MALHNLRQQTEYLRTALEQEKKPLGFLIGAGAPMSIRNGNQPLIPGIEQLTEYVKDEIQEEFRGPLQTLIGHLPNNEQNNLEILLNYVRTLESLPGTEPVRGVEVTLLSDIDAAICRVVREHVDALLPGGQSGYVSLALWIRAMNRVTPTHVFTTNYDLLIEQALERNHVAYFDGFVGTHEPRFDIQAIEEDQLPSRWTLLWKLHGSINWSLDDGGNVTRRSVEAADHAALVYPSHLKYDQSRRLPFLAMMDRLKAYLRSPGAILITCGFSFRDQHINEVIDLSLRANPTANVHGLMFGSLTQYAEGRALAGGLPNLALLADDGAIIGGHEGPWSNPSTTTDEGSEQFRLGDFARLGELLRDVTGESSTLDRALSDD